MAFQEVTLGNNVAKTETIYPNLKDVAAGTVLAEGTYTGSHTGNFGDTFYVQQADGISVGLNSWGKLKALIGRANLVANQSIIKVTYLGQVEIAEGAFAGRMAHDFKLEIDA